MASPTTVKGEIACLKFDQRCLEKGYVPCKPLIDVGYDRLVEKDGRFWRVQVKYAGSTLSKNTNGSAAVRLERIGHDWKKAKKYNRSEVDAVVAYIPQINKICWLEVSDFENKRSVSLRYKPTKNGQYKNCILVEDRMW